MKYLTVTTTKCINPDSYNLDEYNYETDTLKLVVFKKDKSKIILYPYTNLVKCECEEV